MEGILVTGNDVIEPRVQQLDDHQNLNDDNVLKADLCLIENNPLHLEVVWSQGLHQ